MARVDPKEAARTAFILLLSVCSAVPTACGGAGTDTVTAPGGPPATSTPVPGPGGTWRPPLGIPAPPFGITETVSPTPDPWSAPTPGFYYVDESHPSATDSGNLQGSPSLPRRTIPSELPAGAVVELHGTYRFSHRSPRGIRASGTASRPVFIRGKSARERPRISSRWEIEGSYFVLEHLEFALEEPTKGALLVRAADHGVLRHSDVHGNLEGGGVVVIGSDRVPSAYIVIYDTTIHDNGDRMARFDQDIHGIVVGSRVDHLWVVDNELYRNSGDGIQINAGRAQQATTHHVYVGRNVAHENKQTGFWTKQAVDVIFSENLSYSHRRSNSSSGQGMGFQYAPERVWFLYNHIHDCEYGIAAGSDNGQGFGRDVYLIGNVIHDIHHREGYNPETSWSNAGIMLPGGTNRYVVNNTIHDVDGGIHVPGPGSVSIVNNVVSGITEAMGSHIFIESGSTASRSTLRYNLLEGAVRIKWAGTGSAYSLSGFQAAFPGQGQNTVNASALFVGGPASEDFQLQAGSPAVDTGTPDLVYAVFRGLYGIEIAEDLARTPRPQGSAWDLGAYERKP